MKRAVIVTFGIILVFVLAIDCAFAESKFGFVDLSRVFYGYKKTEDYDAKLNTSREAKKKERDKYIKEIMDLQNKLYLLNDNEKAKTLDALDKKREDLEKFDRQASTRVDSYIEYSGLILDC